MLHCLHSERRLSGGYWTSIPWSHTSTFTFFSHNMSHSEALYFNPLISNYQLSFSKHIYRVRRTESINIQDKRIKLITPRLNINLYNIYSNFRKLSRVGSRRFIIKSTIYFAFIISIIKSSFFLPIEHHWRLGQHVKIKHFSIRSYVKNYHCETTGLSKNTTKRVFICSIDCIERAPPFQISVVQAQVFDLASTFQIFIG